MCLTVERPTLKGDSGFTRPTRPLVGRLGYWGGLATAATAIAFPLSVAIGALAGVEQAKWTGEVDAYARSFNPAAMLPPVIGSILIVPAFLVLSVAIHSYIPEDRKPLTLIALLFAAAYAATVGINYFVQLASVRLNLEAGTTEGLGLFVMDNPHSLFYSLEGIGYLWQALSALFLSLALGRKRIERWIKALFSIVVVASGLGLVGLLMGLEFLHPVLLVSNGIWVVTFSSGAVLCAILLGRTQTVT